MRKLNICRHYNGHTLQRKSGNITKQALEWNGEDKRKRGRGRHTQRREVETETRTERLDVFGKTGAK